MKITLKKTCRNDRFVPVCPLAHLLLDMTAASRKRDNTTFSDRHIEIMKRRGCEIEVLDDLP